MRAFALTVIAVVAALFVLVASSPVLADAVVGSGTAGSCTEAALNAALAIGGSVTFNCGGSPVTITVTNPKTIAANTSIDGRGFVTLDGNHATKVFMVNSGVTLTLANLTIANSLAASGGAIGNGGTLTVTNSTFSGNSANVIYSYGGGAILNGGTLTVTNSTFTGNSANAIGNSGTLTVTNSTFSNNLDGGAINNRGTLTVTNSTFTGNSGGAINGGGTLTNTIVAKSSSDGNCSGTITDGGHNLDDGTSCGFSAANGSLSNTNPQLNPVGLGNNGGPTQTIALLVSSPAINAADERVCATQPVNGVDQRGYVRPGDGYPNCSIGAYEFDSSAPPTPTATTTPKPTATPTATKTPLPCVGDCGGTGVVTISDLITLVKIALASALPGACPNGVPSGTKVNIALVIQAVNNALNGCGG